MMMSSNKGKRPLRHLSALDKINAIQRIHDGESKASVARDIGVPESTLRGWCKNEEKLRFMSSSGTENKLPEKLAEKLNDESSLYDPPTKRVKLDNPMPINFATNGKIKYDEMSYKNRNSLSAIDFSGSDKGLGSLNFNGMNSNDYGYGVSPDLTSMNNHIKCEEPINVGYGADAKQNDPTKSDISMAAISPLTSLSHLSGMTGINHSPLGLSFNDIASNLSLFAQLSNQSAMGAVAGLNNSQSNGLRTVRPKQMPHSLTVKNLAKLQNKSSTTDNIGMGVDMADKSKKPSTVSSSQDPALTDVFNTWIRRCNAINNFNNMYSAMPSSSSPNRSSPFQQQQQLHQKTATVPSTSPLVASTTPQTTSSTPSGTSDDIKQPWVYHLYKYNQLSQLHTAMMSDKFSNGNINSSHKQMYENFLLAHLAKDFAARSPVSSTDCVNNNMDNTNKPEDLSKQSHRNYSNNEVTESQEATTSTASSPAPEQKFKISETDRSNVRNVLDEILCNNNNNVAESDPDDLNFCGPSEALQYGLKFLKWLESYSDPMITKHQVMQFRSLLTCLQNSSERANNPTSSSKSRRRK